MESKKVQGDWSHYWHNFSNGGTPSSTILHSDFLDTVSRTDSVLDVGCGYGRITSRLAERSGAVVGVDLNKEELRHASLNNAAANILYGVMSGAELGFSDETFDKVTLLGVLGGVSLSTREDIVSEAHRVLKPGGVIYASEFAMKPNNRRYVRGKKQSGEHGVILASNGDNYDSQIRFVGKHFYPSELSTLVQDYGFSDVKVRNPRTVLSSVNSSNYGQRFVRKMVCVWGQKPQS